MKIKDLIFSFFLLGIMLLMINGCKKNDSVTNPADNNTGSSSGWFVLGNLDISNVYDLYIDKNNNLFAAGAFTDGSGNHYIAKWDGSSWTQIVIPNINGNVYAICGDGAGNLYIGGAFRNSTGNTYVIKWDGSAWNDIGGPQYSGDINALASGAGGQIYMAADGLNFDGTLAGNVSVVVWNGISWGRMGSFLNTYINTLWVDPGGNIYAGGGGLSAAPNGGFVAKWNGNDWDQIGDLSSFDKVLTLSTDPNGNLYAGGGADFQSGFVAKWNGSSWTDLGLNANDRVKSLCFDPEGNLYAGGAFYNSSNKFYVGKWDGSSWSNLGLDAYSGIDKLAYSSGTLYAAGSLEFILNSGHYIAAYKF